MWYQQQLEKLALRLPTVRVVVYMWPHTQFVQNAEKGSDNHDEYDEDQGLSDLPDDDINVNMEWVTDIDNNGY